MQEFVTILLDGLTYASYLFIVSVGLTIVFGVMKILNVAHGAFYAWGAYSSAFLITFAADQDWPDWVGFPLIIVAAILVGLVLGFLIERLILRYMYHQDEVLIVLATFGLFLVLEDVILLVFGVDPYFAYQPTTVLGGTSIIGVYRDFYSLSLLLVAVVVAFACWYGLTRTKWGKLISVVIYDREASLAMGINVGMVYLVIFIIGTMLGALGGAYLAPTLSVAPGFGIDVIVLSFAVVVIGGMGSIPGAIIGAVLVGILRAIAVHKMPEIELFVVFGVMAIVLIIRPEGLFAPGQGEDHLMRDILANDKTVRWLGLFCIALIVVGAFLPTWIVNNVMFGMAKGLAVLGLLVLWRTGLISFGHALYFGIGAYSVALMELGFGVTDLFIRLIIAVAAASLVGFLLGFILRRYRAIFFAMLSLAFSMVLYGILVKMEALGSTDGFSVSPSTFFGVSFEDKYLLFSAIVVVCFISACLVQFYLKSALGYLTTAIRDNEIRVEYLGYSVQKAIHIKYVISAALAGAAGAMLAMSLGQVDPDSMVNWTVSGELVFITIMAGPGSVAAPFLGAVVFEFLRTFAFEYFSHAWQLIVGGTLLLIIFFLPRGIWSLIEKVWTRKETKA